MAEQGGHGLVAAQSRAVDLDERTTDLALALLQLVDPAGELRLALSTGWPGQENRRGRADHHPLDLVDHSVEGGAAGRNPGFKERGGVFALGGEALGDLVIAGKVEVDNPMRA